MNQGGISQAQYLAVIVTTTPSLTLPPALLEKGSAYVFRISAIASPIDASIAPYRSSPTYASADVLTSMALP